MKRLETFFEWKVVNHEDDDGDDNSFFEYWEFIDPSNVEYWSIEFNSTTGCPTGFQWCRGLHGKSPTLAPPTLGPPRPPGIGKGDQPPYSICCEIWQAPLDCESKEHTRHTLYFGRQPTILDFALAAHQALDYLGVVFALFLNDYSLVWTPNGASDHSIYIYSPSRYQQTPWFLQLDNYQRRYASPKGRDHRRVFVSGSIPSSPFFYSS
jgi:hypothetical protein